MKALNTEWKERVGMISDSSIPMFNVGNSMFDVQAAPRLPRCGLDAAGKKEWTSDRVGHRIGSLEFEVFDVNLSDFRQFSRS